MNRLLVGVDGSPAAAAALGWAGRLARRVHSEVVVANVFESDQAELSPEHYDELRRAAGERLRGDWSAPLGDAVPHRSLLLTGSPDVLLEAAEAEDVDLLVVGPRGRGG